MRRAEPVAGLGGIVLSVSLFLPWYGTGIVTRGSGGSERTSWLATTTAWDAFAVIDVLIALLAVLAVLVPITSLASSGPARPMAVAVLASAFGWIATLLVVYRIVDVPGEGLEVRYGAWVALAASLIAWVGSWLSLRDESTPGAVVPSIPRRPAP